MSSPYLLPEGNVHIAFSGGRTSAYMLYQILLNYGVLPSRVIVSFQNTGREMPATLDFVQEVGAQWNIDIVWLEYRARRPSVVVVNHNSASRDGEPFEALIAKKKALPNQQQKWCSAELKTLTAKRYLVAEGWKRWTNVVGFRADEEHRTVYEDNRATTITPLVAAGVTKRDVVAFWKHQPFDLRLPVVNNKTVGGNCDGCFLKSEAWQATLARDYPERAAWWERLEGELGRTFSKRYTRRGMREFVERQGDLIPLLSKRGVLCQADDGECMAA